MMPVWVMLSVCFVSLLMYVGLVVFASCVCLSVSVSMKLYISLLLFLSHLAFSALTLLVGQQEGHPARKKMVGWWRWALVSSDGVAPSRMISVSASVNLTFTIKSRSSLLAPAHPGGPGKNGRKTVVWWWWCSCHILFFHWLLYYLRGEQTYIFIHFIPSLLLDDRKDICPLKTSPITPIGFYFGERTRLDVVSCQD